MNGQRARMGVAAGAAAIVLAAASTFAFAATGGVFRSRSLSPNGQCSVPALGGSVVDVELANMGGRMMMGTPIGGMMRVLTNRAEVPAGAVSLRVANVGSLVHELVVLPLTNGQEVGQRPAGGAGKVDEAASVGEASRTCGAGAGDGIDPGAIGSVTLTLQPGIYELVCNLPGHYAAGMYTALRVT